MNKELLLVIDSVANEKGVSKDIIFLAMEDAIIAATKKKLSDNDANITVKIDRNTGSYKTVREWTIVEEDYEIKNYSSEMYVDVANEKGKNVIVGDILKEPIESISFGRIAAMKAKQTIFLKVREEEKRIMVKKFEDKIGSLIYGEVKRISRDFLIINLNDNAEGILPKKYLLSKENYHINDKIKCCIFKIDKDFKLPQIILTRTDKTMLLALLKLEIPEISEKIIDVVNIARDPGSRSKVSVKSNDKRIDPIGSCIGIRGTRIQAITNELHGERIDIILWDENPAQYVINAISPADAISIIQDEDKFSMQISVCESQLSQAIGKNGQNVRLATLLTGWNIQVLSENHANQKQKEMNLKISQYFIEILDIDVSIAEILVNQGFTTIEEIAYIDKNEIIKMNIFDKKTCEYLQEHAKIALISKTLTLQQPEENLLKMNYMTVELADSLAKNNIFTVQDLADLAIDDLQDMVLISKEKAAQLIMTARAPWFSDKG